MKLLTKIFKIVLFGLISFSIIIALLYGQRDKDVAELKQKYAPLPSAFLAMDGMAVHYRDEGNPLDTLPIVLIHGTGSSLHTFNEWTAVLKGKYVGIENLGNGIWKVYYRDVFLGFFNETELRNKEKSIRLETNLV